MGWNDRRAENDMSNKINEEEFEIAMQSIADHFHPAANTAIALGMSRKLFVELCGQSFDFALKESNEIKNSIITGRIN